MRRALKAIAVGLAVGVACAVVSLIPALVNLFWLGLGVELTQALALRPACVGAIGFLVGFLLVYFWPMVQRGS